MAHAWIVSRTSFVRMPGGSCSQLVSRQLHQAEVKRHTMAEAVLLYVHGQQQ